MTSFLHRLKPIYAVPLVWAVLAALFVAEAWNKSFLALFRDTDDATRLVVVRDLMGGQNWFDHIEHRFNVPFGAEIHWSRLIDLPLSLIVSVVNLMAPGQGEHVALFVWPLLWLLPALYLTVLLVRRLCGDGHDLVALVIAALAVPVFAEFVPGRIDHHNVQAVLILWLALETQGAFKSNAAAWRAGIAAATSLAIGAETAPIIAAAIIGFGLNWVIDPGFAPRLWRFGAGLAAAMAVHFLIAVGPGDWLTPQCDATSIVFVLAAFGVGLVFAGLIRLPFYERDWGKRLAAAAAGAALIAAVLLELFPACAAGPFASLPPWLRTAWLDRVGEVQPLWRSLFSMPAFTIGAVLPVVLAFGAIVERLRSGSAAERRVWLTYALMVLAALLATVLQLRGVRLAALLAVPGGVWLILILRRFQAEATGRLRPLAGLGLAAGWFGVCGFAILVLMSFALPAGKAANGTAEAADPLASCLTPGAFARLGQLSPARVAAPIDLGPYLLLMTPHAAIGSPYHRNGEGIGDTFRIFGGPEAQARAILNRRGIDLVVSCDALLGVSGGTLGAPDSLKAQFTAGETPGWLRPVPAGDSPLKIYRVAR